MKGTKVLVDVILFILITINLFFLVLTTFYGGIASGIFHNVLTDRPEFSNLSDTQIRVINFLSTFLIIIGTALPLFAFLIPNIEIKRKRILLVCLSLLPISFLFTRLIIFPEPDSFTQTNLGEFQVRKYEWDTRNGRIVKWWISEKPSSAYNYQDRIKWLPVTLPEKNN